MRRNTKINQKLIRLKNYDYFWPGFYFVTICVDNRKCVLGEIKERDEFFGPKMFLSELGRIAEDVWMSIPDFYKNVELYEFVVMPNHLHGVIVINDEREGQIHEFVLQNQKSAGVIHKSSDAIRELHLQKNILKSSGHGIHELYPQKKLVGVIHESPHKTIHESPKKKSAQYASF